MLNKSFIDAVIHRSMKRLNENVKVVKRKWG